MTDARAHVFIKGRVQGVSFRYYTKREAEHQRIKGWVRNLMDGRVEAVFEGPKERVDEIVAWCHEGPPAAHVEVVDVTWEPRLEGLSDFRVKL